METLASPRRRVHGRDHERAAGSRRRRRSASARLLASSLLLLAWTSTRRHWSAPSSLGIVAAAADDGDELDAESRAMAERIVGKIRGDDDPHESWATMARVLEGTYDEGDPNYRSSPAELRGRLDALRWLAHDDEGKKRLSPEEYDRGLVQRYALASIYFSSGGDSWHHCSRHPMSDGPTKGSACPSAEERYLSGANHFKWSGVKGKEGMVQWLDLSDRGLDSEGGSFPPLELTLLSPRMELLWVSENEGLGGTLPEYLGEFQNLVSLSAYGTSMSGTIPPSIYSLPKLNSIRLYRSKFSGTISPEVGKLEALKWLWIHENDFTGPVPKEIGGLSMLEGLTLHGNGLSNTSQSPVPVCALKEIALKHLWVDCEDGSLEEEVDVDAREGEGSTAKFLVKEEAKACSCCTRCFPRKADKEDAAMEGVNAVN